VADLIGGFPEVGALAEDLPKGGNGQPTQEVVLDYVKGQFFRVVHADGIIGGPTPQGQLHIAFYSERPPIPKRTVHPVSAGGALGSPSPEKTVVRDCTAIRELDVDVMMSFQVAEQFYLWLGQRLDEMKKVFQGGSQKQ
jgi:hypothetical protein